MLNMDLFLILQVNKKFNKLILILFLLLILGGCAPSLKEIPEVSKEVIEAERLKQRKIALFTYLERKERLNNVWYNLLVGAAPFCEKNLSSLYGFEVHNNKMYKEEDIKLLNEKYLVEGNFTVWYLHPELPAAKAGLQINDKILKINSKEPKEIEEFIEIIKNSKEIELVVERKGEVLNFKIQPVKGCNYSVYLIFDESINAWAAPQGKVFVTTGLMRFLQSEKELAFVLGHELAHHVLGHITKKMGNVILGSIIDILIAATTGIDTQGAFQQLGALVYSKEFEKEADYIGTYIAARGGYDIRDAAEIWRRIAAEFPQGIDKSFLATHPSTPERFVFIEKTAQEIEEKKIKGEPLIPSQEFIKKQKEIEKRESN